MTTIIISNNNNDIADDINQGLDYLLFHCFAHQKHPQPEPKGQQIWPRTISTRTTENRQIVVYSKEEALARFKQANYLDCKISAFPFWKPTIMSDFAGIKNAIAPDFIMIDLDIGNFDDDDEDMLKHFMPQTLWRIKDRLADFRPAVIWSGNGYHIYVIIDAPILENISEFSNTEQPSTKFLRFAEYYLSNGKCDPKHNETVSVNNCMLRVPGSINSKNGAQVKIVKKFNEKAQQSIRQPNINLLIGSFCAYLADKEIKEARYRKAMEQFNNSDSFSSSTSSSNESINYYYEWIEKLLQTPLPCNRRICMWRILAPYLINVKHLSYDQSSSILTSWLDNKCRAVYGRLPFNSRSEIKQNLNNAIRRGYFPIGLSKLKLADNEFYNFLQSHGVIN